MRFKCGLTRAWRFRDGYFSGNVLVGCYLVGVMFGEFKFRGLLGQEKCSSKIGLDRFCLVYCGKFGEVELFVVVVFHAICSVI